MSEQSAEKDPDPIAARVECPACGAAKGQPCRTMIDGVDTGWTHDARFYADLGHRVTPPEVGRS